MKSASLAIALAVVLSTPAVLAQAPVVSNSPPPHPCNNPSTENVHAFVLKNAAQQEDANQMYSALRNMLAPDNKSYFVPSQNTIFFCGTPEQTALAQKILNDLDKPKKVYRLTYTVTDMDAGKKVGSQRFSVVAIGGQKTTFKQGSRVPVATGSYGRESNSQQTQFTYVDVGMNFDATIDEMGNGVRLNTSINQSSIGEEHSGAFPQDPIIRQTDLRGSSFLIPGKPLTLGSIDVPGSTHHLDIEVVMEPLP